MKGLVADVVMEAVGVRGKPATPHLEDLWIRNVTGARKVVLSR